MIKYENECVSCDLPCLGDTCPNRNVPHLYCDHCENEAEQLYWHGSEQLCEDCLIEQHDIVEVKHGS